MPNYGPRDFEHNDYCGVDDDNDDGENGDDDDDDDDDDNDDDCDNGDDDGDDDNDDKGFFTNRLYQCAVPAHQLALLAPLVRWL